MQAHIFRRLIVFGVAGSLLVVSGCAREKFAPPSPELRSQLGNVGVVPVTTVKAPGMKPPNEPVKGMLEGVVSGAKQGAGYGFFGGASLCAARDPFLCLYGLMIGVTLAPPGALIGATLGAARARTKEEVEAAAKQIEQAFAELAKREFTGQLAEKLIRRAREKWDLTFLRRSREGDDGSYEELAEQGLDTALVLSVTRFTFAHFGEIDPDMTLEASVAARLVRTSDDWELYRRDWRYRGSTHSYFDLAAAGGALLREEIDKGYTALADRVVSDLFVTTEPESKDTGQDRGVWTTGGPTFKE